MLGREGLDISPLGLGCMGTSEFYGAADEHEAVATIQRTVYLGVTLLDTADMYGTFTNERLLGRALVGRRDGAVVASKFGFVRNEEGRWLGISGGADYVRTACEASLRRLGLGRIDLYHQHRVDRTVPTPRSVEGDARAYFPRFQGENFEGNVTLLERLAELARAKAVAPAQLALAWLHRGDDVVPIPGTKRRSRLEQNVRSVEVALDTDEIAQLDEVFPPGAAAGARYPAPPARPRARV